MNYAGIINGGAGLIRRFAAGIRRGPVARVARRDSAAERVRPECGMGLLSSADASALLQARRAIVVYARYKKVI